VVCPLVWISGLLCALEDNLGDGGGEGSALEALNAAWDPSCFLCPCWWRLRLLILRGQKLTPLNPSHLPTFHPLWDTCPASSTGLSASSLLFLDTQREFGTLWTESELSEKQYQYKDKAKYRSGEADIVLGLHPDRLPGSGAYSAPSPPPASSFKSTPA
jgi:hypothetical protein